MSNAINEFVPTLQLSKSTSLSSSCSSHLFCCSYDISISCIVGWKAETSGRVSPDQTKYSLSAQPDKKSFIATRLDT